MYNQEIISKILDQDGDLKDINWASEMVRLVTLNAKSVISKNDYDAAANVLFGRFPDAHVNQLFGGEAMTRIKDKLSKDSTVYFFERIRNSLIDERNQAELKITVNSLDPQKEDKKKFDKELLKNRKGIENLINEVTANNGMPPKKIEGDDYNGNTEDFEGDEFDTTELDDFFKRAWGLKDQWAYQNAINHIFQENEVKSDCDKRVNDIFICLHNFSRVFVDDIEGSEKIKHLYPWEVEVLHATGSNSFKDAQGFNLPNKQTNVRGFMKMFGSYFDFEKDWGSLLIAANGGTQNQYTGITQRYVGTDESLIYGVPGKTINFNTLLDMPISYRYTEWKTITKTIRQA